MTASEFEKAVDIQITLFKRMKLDKKTGEWKHRPPLENKEVQDWFWANDLLYSFNNFPESTRDDPNFFTDKAWKRVTNRLSRFYESKALRAYLESCRATVNKAKAGDQPDKSIAPTQ